MLLRRVVPHHRTKILVLQVASCKCAPTTMLQPIKMSHDRGRKGRGFCTSGTAAVRWAASFVGLFGAIVNSHLATNSYGDTDNNNTRSSSRSDGVAVRGCRCAVLYSGHVRSFVRPQVHLSQMINLIEPLETECEVDVFMYLSGILYSVIRYHFLSTSRASVIRSTSHVSGMGIMLS